MQRQSSNDVGLSFVASQNVQRVDQPLTLDGVFKSKRLKQAISAASCRSPICSDSMDNVDIRGHLLENHISTSSGGADCHESDNANNGISRQQSVEGQCMSAIDLPLLHLDKATCGNAPRAPACSNVQQPSLQINGDPTLGSPPHMRENRREAKTTTTTSERRLRQQRLATRSNICVERSCAAKNQDTSASSLQTNQERMVNPPANVHEDRAKATRPGASSTKRAKRQRSVTEPTISVGESSAATNEDTSASALQTNQECMVNPPADVHADRAKATRPGTSSTKRAKRQRSVTKPAISVGESSAATDEEQPSNAVTHVHENHPKATRSGGTSTRRVRQHQSTSRSTFCMGESSGSTNQSASPVYEDLGDCTYTCRYCKAAFWYGECIKGNHSYSRQPQYHLCCRDGKVLMQPEPDPPEYIKNLLGDPNFIHNVRAYNQMFAMTSFGARIDSTINRGRGPYVFKVSGQIYHYIGSLCPTGDDDPCFLQLYVYDTQNEVQNRMNHFKGSERAALDPTIVEDPTLGSPPHMRENRREAKTTTTTSERRLRQQRLATRSNICVERSCAAKNQDTSASTLQTNQERMVNPPANVHEDRAKATRPGASSTKRAKRQRSVTEPTISVGESSAATNEDTSASALQTNQECMVNPPADVHADRAKATRPGTSSTKRAKRQRSVTKPAISVGESSAATDEEQPSNAVTHVHENHPKATRSGGTSTRRVRQHQSTSRSTFCMGESSGSTNQSASPVYEDLGDCTYTCRYCKAAFWYGECIKGNHSYSRQPQYHLCCRDGKVLMQPEPDPPEYIKNLLGDPNFIHNVRAYNQMFAMTSFGARIDSTINRGRGPYVFKVSGQIYHYIGSLCPTGDDDPCFLQLYVYDTQNEVQNRMNHFKGSERAALDPTIVEGLIHFLDDHNELVQIFRTARDRCAEADVPDFKVRLYNGDGARTYELPTSDALGAIVFDSGPTTQSDYDVDTIQN
ncbi:hypothetical protein CTI12_AA381910 [Artemisia annua]|uniref:Helitron helicase-like domain-containing protein n=1 Tax=Artemisia annua TaxID=35608 RepID=A0A2U1MGQ4_ARTAN|nr:hypothetical protein CTI12_AA381910 [Artemisia annua]